MRETFQAELDALIGDMAAMARMAAQMMTNASTALHQADLALAEVVISRDDEMNALHDDMEQRCISLLALQAPVAADLVGDARQQSRAHGHRAEVERPGDDVVRSARSEGCRKRE